MIRKLFDLINALDRAITSDRLLIIAAEQRIAAATRRKAFAQRLLARQRGRS